MRKLLVVTMCALAMAASVGCAEGSGASPVPDPYLGIGHVTIDPTPHSYEVRGVIVVFGGKPGGYAPGGVIYRYWNPDRG